MAPPGLLMRMTIARTVALSAYRCRASTVSRASKISPSMGMMATFCVLKMSPDDIWFLLAVMNAARKVKNMMPMRQPLKTPKKKLGQPDLPLVPVDLDEARADRLSHFERFIELHLAVALNLGDMRQAFHSLGEADEQAEIGDLGDRSDHLVADVVRFGEVVPLIGKELFDGQREPLIVAVHVDDSRLNRIALLQHFVGVLQPPVP